MSLNKEDMQTLPLNDIISLSVFMQAVNKTIIEINEHIGRHIAVRDTVVTLPESGVEVSLLQDEITRMMKVGRVV